MMYLRQRKWLGLVLLIAFPSEMIASNVKTLYENVSASHSLKKNNEQKDVYGTSEEGLKGSPLSLSDDATDKIRKHLKPQEDWQRLSALLPGRRVTIETKKDYHKVFGKKVKGSFVKYHNDSITVKLSSGQNRTVSREAVKKITTPQKRAAWEAPAAGAIIGTIVGLIVLPGADLVFTGKLLVAGALMGLPGMLVGFIVNWFSPSEVIYKASNS